MSEVSVWKSLPTDLIQIGELKVDRAQDIPVWLEFHVDPETAPFLITSTRSWLWVTPRRNIIRVGTRFLDMHNLFMEIVQQVADTGVSSLWENVHPSTRDGVLQAIQYVHSYGFPDIEVLAAPDIHLDTLKDLDVPVQVAPWLQSGHMVVVPRDREYVGFAMVVRNGMGVCLLHNPSRSIAICR